MNNVKMMFIFFIPEFKVQSNLRRIINSTYNTLTIVSAINTIGVSNPDYGRYTCEVCAPPEMVLRKVIAHLQLCLC